MGVAAATSGSFADGAGFVLGNDEAQLVKLLKVVRLVKLLRLARLRRLYEKYGHKYYATLQMLKKFSWLIRIGVFGHWLACIVSSMR